MPPLQARSGIARAGVTRCGWSPPLVRLYIDGIDRTSLVLGEDWELTIQSDQPSTLAFRIKNFTPTTGKDVRLVFAAPDEYIFAGTIVQIEAHPAGPGSAYLIWSCMAVDYRWLLDRYDRVFASYESVGANVIVHDILSRFTDGGFKKGRVSSALGNLTIGFEFATVTEALLEIASAVNGYLEITPYRRVNILGGSELAQVSALTQSQVLTESLTFREDLTQVRTRVRVRAAGGTVVAAAPATNGLIEIDNPNNFSGGGGQAVCDRNLITYTGIIQTLILPEDPDPPPPRYFLSGVTGIVYDIPAGAAIDVLVTVTDSAATTALASRLGGGLSGQATFILSESGIAKDAASTLASSDLARQSAPLNELQFQYKTLQRSLQNAVARQMTVSITDPMIVSGTFRIQMIKWIRRGPIGGKNAEWFQEVTAAPWANTLTGLLRALSAEL